MSVVDRLVKAISRKDIDAFGSLYANEAVMYEPLLPEPASGKREIMEGEAALFRAFSDIEISVINKLGSGRVMIAEVVLSATNDGPLDVGAGEVPATGRRIEIPMVWAFDLNEEGLVVEERDYFDTARIVQQLGLNEQALWSKLADVLDASLGYSADPGAGSCGHRRRGSGEVREAPS